MPVMEVGQMFTESCEPLISALDYFEVSQTMLDQSQSHTMEEVKRVSDVFNESCLPNENRPPSFVCHQ